MEFIEEQKFLHADLSPTYSKFGDLFLKKLWHQLTDELELFLSNKSNQRGDNFYSLYDGFISRFEGRLSQLRLAQLISLIIQSFQDPQRSIQFVSRILEARKRLGPESSLFLDAEVIIMKLKLGQSEECRILLDEAKEKLSALGTNETAVFSKYYRADVEFRKLVGPAHEFYKSSLLYLSYTPIDEMNLEDRYMLATDMALAALCGENLYNFGEIIATPVLSTLLNTPNSWLFDLVLCLNNGDIASFNDVIQRYSEVYFSHPTLAAFHDAIKQKVVLLSLMSLVFRRSSHDRCISYQEIADNSKIPLDQVDWVLMRAMSLGLIRGSIDEVDQTVNVTWIQPRVLDKGSIQLLCSQLDDWTQRVKSTLVGVEDQAAELYVS